MAAEWIFEKAATDHAHHGVVDLRIERARRLRLRFDDLARDVAGVRRVPRQRAGGHLVVDDAEREDVGAEVDRLSGDLLRRHVRDGARIGPLLLIRRRRRPFFARHQIQQIESAEFHLTSGRDHDGITGHVAMHDIARLQKFQHVGELIGDSKKLDAMEWLAIEFRRQRFSFHDFHHHR